MLDAERKKALSRTVTLCASFYNMLQTRAGSHTGRVPDLQLAVMTHMLSADELVEIASTNDYLAFSRIGTDTSFIQ